MPRKAELLSALQVKRLRHSGQRANAVYAVGGVDGLMLQITPGGARSWILRCKVGDRRRHMGLGPYPEVPLSSARDKARELREQIRSGLDPVLEKKRLRSEILVNQNRGLTFSEAMERFLIGKLSEFENPKHKKQWRATLDKYAVPMIGNQAVSDLVVADVLRVLEPIWSVKNETATRLRGRIEAVIAWATVAGYRDGDNPARWRGNLDAVLPKPSKVAKVEHHPALQLDHAAEWFSEVQGRLGNASRALEFMALTVARSGEVRGAKWEEIDFNNKLWLIPAARVKTRLEHRIPLTDKAITLLSWIDRIEGSEFVFSAPRGGELSDSAVSGCMKRIHGSTGGKFVDRQSGRLAVPHGLRSTFRDWAAERTDYPRDMAEIALAHKVGSDVERAYRRGDMLEKRREMMTSWGKFLT